MKYVTLIIIMILSVFSVQAAAHSGRTDSSGGHNCSAKSVQKGLCSGYHYHGGKWVRVSVNSDFVGVEPTLERSKKALEPNPAVPGGDLKQPANYMRKSI